MGALVYQWIDLLWLPVGLAVVHRGQRLMTAGFVLSCVFSLRLQLELMAVIGFSRGFFQLIEAPLYNRGLVIYAPVIALFLVLAHFSPRTHGAVFLAAAIALYIVAFCISMLAMIL